MIEPGVIAFCASLRVNMGRWYFIDNHVLFLLGGPSVQKQSIPVLLEGRDALVRSQTGSGQLSFDFCPSSTVVWWVV